MTDPIEALRLVREEAIRTTAAGYTEWVISADAMDAVRAALAKVEAPIDGIEPWQKWEYKPNRGSGAFVIIGLLGDRVTLRNWRGKSKTISRSTLKSDYQRAGDTA
jgi:hypothetical protein